MCQFVYPFSSWWMFGIMKSAALKIHASFCEPVYSFLMGIYPGVEFWGYRKYIFSFSRCAKEFTTVVVGMNCL